MLYDSKLSSLKDKLEGQAAEEAKAKPKAEKKASKVEPIKKRKRRK